MAKAKSPNISAEQFKSAIRSVAKEFGALSSEDFDDAINAKLKAQYAVSEGRQGLSDITRKQLKQIQRDIRSTEDKFEQIIERALENKNKTNVEVVKLYVKTIQNVYYSSIKENTDIGWIESLQSSKDIFLTKYIPELDNIIQEITNDFNDNFITDEQQAALLEFAEHIKTLLSNRSKRLSKVSGKIKTLGTSVLKNTLSGTLGLLAGAATKDPLVGLLTFLGSKGLQTLSDRKQKLPKKLENEQYLLQRKYQLEQDRAKYKSRTNERPTTPSYEQPEEISPILTAEGTTQPAATSIGDGTATRTRKTISSITTSRGGLIDETFSGVATILSTHTELLTRIYNVVSDQLKLQQTYINKKILSDEERALETPNVDNIISGKFNTATKNEAIKKGGFFSNISDLISSGLGAVLGGSVGGVGGTIISSILSRFGVPLAGLAIGGTLIWGGDKLLEKLAPGLRQVFKNTGGGDSYWSGAAGAINASRISINALQATNSAVEASTAAQSASNITRRAGFGVPTKLPANKTGYLLNAAETGQALQTASKVGKFKELLKVSGSLKNVTRSAPLAILGAGLDFYSRKEAGQSTAQAATGAGASAAGGILGGIVAGAAAGAAFGGVGAIPGAIIGGFIGSWGAGKAADALTGASSVRDQRIPNVLKIPIFDPATGAETLNTIDGRKAYIYKSLMAAGYSVQQAMGIMANLQSENPSFEPNKSGDNGNAIGIAQWNGERRLKVLAHMQSRGGVDPLVAQVEYLLADLRNYNLGPNQMSQSAYQAAHEMLTRFEKPAPQYMAEREVQYQQTLSPSNVGSAIAEYNATLSRQTGDETAPGRVEIRNGLYGIDSMKRSQYGMPSVSNPMIVNSITNNVNGGPSGNIAPPMDPLILQQLRQTAF